ncbi:MAG: acriflavin resistance protein [Rickettsiales bacterium]|nr:acriflavin resistance protein [Rickettsiales bacterium]
MPTESEQLSVAPPSGGPAGVYSALVARPVATIMAFLAAVVFGAVSYTNLPLNLMPDLDHPTLTVRTEFPGAAPGEVDTYLSDVLEESLSTVPGLLHMESISRAGLSDVVLEFEWNTDMDESAQLVRERLGLMRLQTEGRRPLVLRFDPNLEPILRLALFDSGKRGDSDQRLMALRTMAEDELRRVLERIPGVAAVKVHGGLEQEIRVEVNEGLLHARGLTLSDVVTRLSSENVNIAGGALIEGEVEYLIRTLNEFSGPEQIADLILRTPSGEGVRVRDFAAVSVEPREREIVGRVEQGEAVEIAVYREADANIVAVSRAVRERVFGTEAQQAYVANWRVERAAGRVDDRGRPTGSKKDDAAGTSSSAKKGKQAKRNRWEQYSSRDLQENHRKQTAFLAFSLPDETEILLISDQSRFIEGSIADVIGAGLWGGLLAVLVLFGFLRHGPSTAIIATAIPVSVVVTFAPMYLFGISLNLMSLGGLALCIGMLVDNSIVVLESVHRCREEGDGVFAAAVRGAREVSAAVTASTLTTVAVFLPIVFVTGVAGQLFGHLSLTVVFGLLASLAVALFLIPVLAALRLRGGQESPVSGAGLASISPRAPISELRAFLAWSWGGPWSRRMLRLSLFPLALLRSLVAVLCVWPLWLAVRCFWWQMRIIHKLSSLASARSGRGLARLGNAIESALNALRSGYRRGLRLGLERPSSVLLPALLLFSLSLLGLGRLGQELLPEVHQGVVLAQARLPVGTPLRRTLELGQAFAERSSKLAEVESVYVSAGVEQELGGSSDAGENTANLVVRLRSSANPAAAERRVREQMREVAEGLPKFEANFSSPSLFSFRTPVEVEVFGSELDELRLAADAAVAAIADIEGLRDVRSNLSTGYPEVQLRYDRDRLQAYDIDIGTAAQAVRDKIEGRIATDLRGEGRGRRTEVRVILRDEDRDSLADLARLDVNPRGLPAIPLEAVAELRSSEGPSEIRRSDGERAALVTASLQGVDLAGAADQVEDVLERLEVPEQVRFEVAGQNREMEASLSSLRFALLLAIFLVYIIMASLFESLRQPLVILFAVPMALVGVVAGLLLTQTAVSVVVLIGAIVLAGVVVNNAIVLVDYANQLRARGLDLIDALVEAGSVRLRPILISTLTTVLGLLPMAFAGGEGSEIRQPLALTIIAGLLSATLLTLIVVPVLYRGLAGPRRSP